MGNAALRTRIAVVVYGYLTIIAVFAIFLLVRLLPRRFGVFTIDPPTTEECFVAAVILVAPLVLALIWDRLRGFKIGEIEVVLDEASPRLDIQLASAIQKFESSLTVDLVNRVSHILAEGDVRLVEVNLRGQPYWWSTRLFLLAALTEEYTDVKRLVFVKDDALRAFVGMAPPATVRHALGGRFPALEANFSYIFNNTGPHTAETKAQEIQSIGFAWPGQMFERDGSWVTETEFRQTVSAQTLVEWLGDGLETEARGWSGGPPDKRLYARILTCAGPFVPLLIGPRLATVVDRHQLVERLASASVS